jgi:hypothetical protein
MLSNLPETPPKNPQTPPFELGRVLFQYAMLAFIQYDQLHRVNPVDQRTINAFMHWCCSILGRVE